MGLREKCVQPALRNAVFVIIRLQIEKKKKTCTQNVWPVYKHFKYV